MIKRFKLGSRQYRVKKGHADMRDLGLCDSPNGIILIREKFDGKTLPEDSQEQTLFHEATHAIFNELGRNDLGEDEALVQSFSLLMHQFFRTMR